MSDPGAKKLMPVATESPGDPMHAPTLPIVEVLGWLGFEAKTAKKEARKRGHFKLDLKGRATAVWQGLEWQVLPRRGKLIITDLRIRFASECLAQAVGRHARKEFGPKTTTEVVQLAPLEFFCFFEFSSPGSREKMRLWQATEQDPMPPFGVAGFRLTLSCEGDRLHYFLSDHFAIGFVPDTFASQATALVEGALQFRRLQEIPLPNLFEGSISLVDLASSFLSKLPNPAKKAPLDQRIVQFLEALEAAACEFHRYPVKNPSGEDGSQERLGLFAGESDSPVSDPVVARIPLIALEAREHERDTRRLDRAILGRRFSEAIDILRAFDPERLPAHFARRVALVAVTDRRTDTLPSPDSLMKLLPKDMLILSYATQAALRQGSRDGVLEALSKLTMQLAAAALDLDQVSAFDMAIPELLGDAWLKSNPSRAGECYTRVLQSRGEVPRVLRKLAELGKTAGDHHLESTSLARLAKVERRKKDLARIHLRLAEIARDFPDAVEEDCLVLARKSLALDGSQPDALYFFAETLRKRSEPERAIHVVDEFLRSYSAQLSKNWLYAFETLVGDIWDRELARAEIAAKRYESAFELDSNNLETINWLEAYYIESRSSDKLVEVLVAKGLSTSTSASIAQKVLEEVLVLAKDRSRPLLLRLADLGALELRHAEAAFNLEFSNEEWLNLYRAYRKQLEVTTDRVHAGLGLCILSKWAKDKLGNTKAAVAHLLEAIRLGTIDDEGFDFLEETLRRFGEKTLLSRVYDLRINQSQGASREKLIKRLLAMPDFLSETRLDELSIKLFADSGESKTLVERFRYYADMENTDSIRDLLVSLKDLGVGAEREMEVLEALKALVQQRAGRDFAAILTQTTQRIMMIAPDKKAAIEEAIATFLQKRHPEALYDAICQALDLGILPKVPERMLVRYLRKDVARLASYYDVLIASLSGSTKLEVAGRACREIMKRQADEPLLLEWLKLIGSERSLEPEELQFLELKLVAADRAEEACEVLYKQAQHADDDAARGHFLRYAAQLCLTTTQLTNRATEYLQEALALGSEVHLSHLLLANVAHLDGATVDELEYLSKFLEAPQCLEDEEYFLEATKRIIELGTSDGLAKIVKVVMANLTAEKREDTLLQFCRELISNGKQVEIGSRHLLSILVNRPSSEDLAQDLLKIAEVIATAQIPMFLDHAISTFEKHHRADNLRDVLLSLQSSEQLPSEFAAEVALACDLDQKILKKKRTDESAFAPPPPPPKSAIPEIVEMSLFEEDEGTQAKSSTASHPFVQKAPVAKLDDLFADPYGNTALDSATPPVPTQPQHSNLFEVGRVEGEVSDERVLDLWDGVDLTGAQQSSAASAEDTQFEGAGFEGTGPQNTESKNTESKESHADGLVAVEDAALSLQVVATEDEAGGSLVGDEAFSELNTGEPAEATSLDVLELDVEIEAVETDTPLDEATVGSDGIGAVPNENNSVLAQSDTGNSTLPIAPNQLPPPPNSLRRRPWAEAGPGASRAVEESRRVVAAPFADADAEDDGTRLVSGTELVDVLAASESDAASFEARELSHSRESSIEEVPPIDNWREAVRKKQWHLDPRGILHVPFASEQEKHIALQCIAIMSGKVRILDTWHWQVWRHRDQSGYPINGRDRFPKGRLPNVVDSPLFKYLALLQPVLVRLFHERFSMRYLVQKFGQPEASIEAAAKPAAFAEGLLGEVGFRSLQDRLSKRDYRPRALSGLGPEIFYDMAGKVLYFDADFYSTKPPGQLFHRMLFVIWALELRFYFLLMLDPVRNILPLIQEVDQRVKAQGLAKLASALRSKSPIDRLLSELDPNQLRASHLRVGMPKPADLQGLKLAMEERIFQLILSESLDLIGIIEAITGQDIFSKEEWKAGSIAQGGPHIDRLLDFATRLSL